MGEQLSRRLTRLPFGIAAACLGIRGADAVTAGATALAALCLVVAGAGLVAIVAIPHGRGRAAAAVHLLGALTAAAVAWHDRSGWWLALALALAVAAPWSARITKE